MILEALLLIFVVWPVGSFFLLLAFWFFEKRRRKSLRLPDYLYRVDDHDNWLEKR